MPNFQQDAINQANAQVNMAVNPLDYPSIPCDSCGCEYFEQAMVFKKIPGVLLGTGAEHQVYPIPVFVCKKCGDLMPEYKEEIKPSDKNTTNNSSIIL